jgi:hypothetical protein
MRGPTIPATANIACSMPIRVPCIFFGTTAVVVAVMLVPRLYWKIALSRAIQMKIFGLNSAGMIVSLEKMKN